MGPIVRQYDGVIDKFIGDAIMAIFPMNVDNAVNAALTMLRALSDFNQPRQRSGEEPISLGIGLNTGNLMLGIIGEHGRMDGTVISDSVNLAARLEGLTKTFGSLLLISEHTLARIHEPDQYHCRFLGKVLVKGKNQAVSVYEIYDGDPENVIKLKIDTTSYFEEGLHNYFAKEFAEAAVLFTNVLKVNPSDKAAQLYLERSAQFMVYGVPDDWQGVEAIENK
jgi:two-component system sensor histidine kinase ChiS